MWATALRQLKGLFPQHACRQYNAMLPSFDFREDRMPQLQVGAAERRAFIYYQLTLGLIMQDRCRFFDVIPAQHVLSNYLICCWCCWGLPKVCICDRVSCAYGGACRTFPTC